MGQILTCKKKLNSLHTFQTCNTVSFKSLVAIDNCQWLVMMHAVVFLLSTFCNNLITYSYSGIKLLTHKVVYKENTVCKLIRTTLFTAKL